MGHSSESRDGLKEKILLFLEDGKDWIVRNKKIFIPAVIAVLVLLLVGVSLMSRKEDSAEAEDGEVSVIPVPEVPLEENAIAAVNELMNNYYTALADGDIEKLELLRGCRIHFRCFSQMKITNPELFQNALKIILVGTGNVLSPHKYFNSNGR